jgi:AcrR family transcriptional regulator
VTRLSPTARREEILAAALRVAATKGLGSTTVRDVAAEMGTSSGLIHHYFASMDDVLAAAFEDAATADLANTQSSMRACDGAGERLSTFFASYTRTDYGAFQMWLDAWAEASRRPALGAASRRLNIAWQKLIATTIVDGIEDGTFTCEDPDAAAWRVLSLLDGLNLQLAAHPGVIENHIVFDWAIAALESELGLPTRTLARPVTRDGGATSPSTSTRAT